MNRYFFILGRNQTLSFSELYSLFKKRSVEFNPLFFKNEVFIIETEKNLDLYDLSNRLGGIIKCGKILFEGSAGAEAGTVPYDDKPVVSDYQTAQTSVPARYKVKDEIKKILSKEIILEKFLKTHEKKNFLGFSLYCDDEKGFNNLKKEIERHLLTLKKELKKEGKSIRLVTSREKRLSSVVVKKNKLLTQGSEINIFIEKDKLYLGRTKEVQDFEGYSFRDFRRPSRDMNIGLIPPKLAKILINLSHAEKEETILDPFCGSGTILSEALLLGYKKIIGSDISLVAINNTKRNLKWLFEEHDIKASEKNVNLSLFDVRKIREHLEPHSVKAIVTEPYLGPPIRLKLGEARIRGIVDNVSQLYLDFFREIKKVIMPRGRIVIVWPVFKVNGNLFPLPILDKVLEQGYRQIDLIPENFKSYRFKELTKRGSIVYSRPDQKVLREIFVFMNA